MGDVSFLFDRAAFPCPVLKIKKCEAESKYQWAPLSEYFHIDDTYEDQRKATNIDPDSDVTSERVLEFVLRIFVNELSVDRSFLMRFDRFKLKWVEYGFDAHGNKGIQEQVR